VTRRLRRPPTVPSRTEQAVPRRRSVLLAQSPSVLAPGKCLRLFGLASLAEVDVQIDPYKSIQM
jgi:hypothetical protein